MGADASLFLFDYSVYRETVTPAFTQFLQNGHVNEWLRDIHRQYTEYWEIYGINSHSLTRFDPVDMRAHCSYLDAQFAVTVPITIRDLYKCDWGIRACKSPTCPERDRCPFFASSDTHDVEELLALFRFAMERCCVSARQFLGRSIDVFFYESALDELGVSNGDPIRSLLERLGRRGFVVGYKWAIGTDGIHGWLLPDEASELSDRLFALNLPEYERTFAAMERFKSFHNILEGHGLGLEFYAPTYGKQDVPFEQLSLSFVRTVCFIASQEGKGVLWGNDFA